MKTHKDLEVFKIAVKFVVEIYRLTATFPRSEIFGLTSQMRRASISIPSNIAEGSARKSSKELIRFLFISLGSLNELETQIEIAQKLDYIGKTETRAETINSLRKMLVTLINKLEQRNKS